MYYYTYFFMSRNKEDEFQYISEDDYKTLISVYQQKTFKLFNENISLEAKVATLSSMVENLNETIGDITKEQEKLKKRTSRKTKVTSAKQDAEESILDNEETFNWINIIIFSYITGSAVYTTNV